MKMNKLFSLMLLLPIIFLLTVSVPSDSAQAMASQDKSPLFDISPMLQFFSNTQHTQLSTVLTATATDMGDNAGIVWIEIYDGSSMIDKKDCDSSQSTCIFTKTVVETIAGNHTYYAKTKDLGNHIISSEQVTVEFYGTNHAPNIDSFVPADTTPEVNALDTLHFQIWASDLDNDPLTYGISFDGNQVSAISSFDYSPGLNDIGSTHHVVAIVSDGKGGQDSQSWDVTVIKARASCALNFNPASPIIYTQQPFRASCSCTNPEANAVLSRNSQIITSENGLPVTISAGIYNYMCNAAETNHYLGASVSKTYIINKAQTILNMNAQPSWNVNYGAATTVSCAANNAEVAPHLYRNSVLVSNPDIQTLTAGNYNYACSASESQNWTAGSVTNALNVGKLNSQVNLLLNGADNSITVIPNQNVVINGTLIAPSAKGGVYYIELWLDGQKINSGDVSIASTRNFASGTHNVTLVYPGSENYLSSSETHFIMVNTDANAPAVTLISPVDNYIDGHDITVSYRVSDNSDSVLDCKVWSDTSGTWKVDAQQQTANGASNSWSYTSLNNGKYKWNVQCRDDYGNSAFAPANWSFSATSDNQAPVITFISPTPDNGAVLNTNTVMINTLITDNIAVAGAVLEWNGLNETMIGSGTNFYSTKKNLTSGTYTFKVYAIDTSGNRASSETRRVTINGQLNGPVIALSYIIPSGDFIARQAKTASLMISNIGNANAYSITGKTIMMSILDEFSIQNIAEGSSTTREFSIETDSCGVNIPLESTVNYNDFLGNALPPVSINKSINVLGSDLMISEFSISDNEVDRGDIVEFEVKVKNNARSETITAENAMARIYKGDELIEEIDLGNIDAGETATGKGSWKTDSTGTFELKTVVDSDNECGNWDNSEESVEITIHKNDNNDDGSDGNYGDATSGSSWLGGHIIYDDTVGKKKKISFETFWMLLLLLLELIILILLIMYSEKKRKRANASAAAARFVVPRYVPKYHN